MEPPYVVKPVYEGSSVGVIIVREHRSHPPQELGREDWAFGDMMLVENYVAGRELTCAVMGDTPLGVIDIVPAEGVFYDYDAKYRKGGSIHVLPAKISPNIYQLVQQLALTAHQSLGCGASVVQTSDTTTRPEVRATSSASKSTRSPE